MNIRLNAPDDEGVSTITSISTRVSANERIWLSSPHMGGEELTRVSEVFASNWIAPLGPAVDAFEKELARVTGTGHAAAVSSGTAAIHLALMILGRRQVETKGDGELPFSTSGTPEEIFASAEEDVICQSFTFSGTVNPVAYVGARPVFVDSEPDTWNMSPQALRNAIEASQAAGRRIRAIIPVHLYGMPAKITQIMDIAHEFGIPVIEDAAEALGSSVQSSQDTSTPRPCGSFGDIAILSFNGNKIITTSGGGALLSNESDIVDTARFLSTQARDKAPHYQHSSIGFNYRMSNVLAAIGLGQLCVLKERVQARRRVYQDYIDALSDLPGLHFGPQEAHGAYSNRWLTTLLVDPDQTGGVTREDIRIALDGINAEARPLWKPMHLQPVFSGCPFFAHPDSPHSDSAPSSVSASLFERGLCLPSGSNMSQEQQSRVITVIRDLFKR